MRSGNCKSYWSLYLQYIYCTAHLMRRIGTQSLSEIESEETRLVDKLMFYAVLRPNPKVY